MTRAEVEAEIKKIVRICRGPLAEAARGVIAAALEANDLETARLADARGRKRCGYDFNQTILGGPLDGQEHAYTCPKCGVTGTYTAPEIIE